MVFIFYFVCPLVNVINIWKFHFVSAGVVCDSYKYWFDLRHCTTKMLEISKEAMTFTVLHGNLCFSLMKGTQGNLHSPRTSVQTCVSLRKFRTHSSCAASKYFIKTICTGNVPSVYQCALLYSQLFVSETLYISPLHCLAGKPILLLRASPLGPP